MTASSVFPVPRARLDRVARRIIQLVIAATALSAHDLYAQGAGTLRGRVTDPAGAAIGGASVHLTGTTLGASTDARGDYMVQGIPAAAYTAVVRRTGFAPDSFTFTVRSSETVAHDVTLRRSAQELERVIISASPRLNETIEQALSKQKNVDNIVTVISGDVIRSLPNANAAEAAARFRASPRSATRAKGSSSRSAVPNRVCRTSR